MYTLLLTIFSPLSQIVTNLGPRPIKYVTFSTYKLAIAKYNLNFKLTYNHLFIPLNLSFFKSSLPYFGISFLKACTAHKTTDMDES